MKIFGFFLLLHTIFSQPLDNTPIIEEVSSIVSNDGTTTLLDPVNLNDNDINKIIKELNDELIELKSKLNEQKQNINELNNTVKQWSLISEEYGALFNKRNDISFSVSSVHQYTLPFNMFHIIALRLPSRDAYIKPLNRHGKFLKKNSNHLVDIVVTSNINGDISIYDQYQSLIYTLNHSDNANLLNNNIGNNNYKILSDISTDIFSGESWFIISRNDTSYVEIYDIAIWKNYNDKIRLDGHIVLDYTIYPKLLSNNLIHDSTIEQNQINSSETEINTETIIASEPEKKSSSKKEAIKKNNNQKGNIKETDIKLREIYVTGVSIYHKKQRKSIIVGYSNGLIRMYKKSGEFEYEFQSPNNSITFISLNKNHEILYATPYGFQFLKIPNLLTNGPFCRFPKEETIVQSIIFDELYPYIMYMSTNNGQIFVYTTKKISTLCTPLYTIRVHSNSPINLKSLPGYLLACSTEELHLYNVSKSGYFEKPTLALVKRFKSEFEDMNENDNYIPPIISGNSNAFGKLLIGISQSDYNINNNKYGMIILQTFTPTSDRHSENNIFNIFPYLPIILAMAALILFWMLYKKRRNNMSNTRNNNINADNSNISSKRSGLLYGGKYSKLDNKLNSDNKYERLSAKATAKKIQLKQQSMASNQYARNSDSE